MDEDVPERCVECGKVIVELVASPARGICVDCFYDEPDVGGEG